MDIVKYIDKIHQATAELITLSSDLISGGDDLTARQRRRIETALMGLDWAKARVREELDALPESRGEIIDYFAKTAALRSKPRHDFVEPTHGTRDYENDWCAREDCGSTRSSLVHASDEERAAFLGQAKAEAFRQAYSGTGVTGYPFDDYDGTDDSFEQLQEG